MEKNLSRRKFIKWTALLGASVISGSAFMPSVSQYPLEHRVKKLLKLGEEEIAHDFNFNPIMKYRKNCHYGFTNIYATTIIRQGNPSYHIALYAPDGWENMQLSIFENPKQLKEPPICELGNFTLQIIYNNETGIGTYWNNTGTMIKSPLNTKITLPLRDQQNVKKLYKNLQTIAQDKFGSCISQGVLNYPFMPYIL